MLKATVSSLKLMFQDRKRAYQQTFTPGVAPSAVLEDLARFCRANETTYMKDERLSAVLEGRREVWLRIQNHLNLTTDELYKIYTAPIKGSD